MPRADPQLCRPAAVQSNNEAIARPVTAAAVLSTYGVSIDGRTYSRRRISVMITRTLARTLLIGLIAALAATSFAAESQNKRHRPPPAPSTTFDWENLDSDIGGVAELKDPNVVNPWGIAVSSSGLVWVADNGTGVATVYFPDGRPFPNSANRLVVTIPASATNTEGA